MDWQSSWPRLPKNTDPITLCFSDRFGRTAESSSFTICAQDSVKDRVRPDGYLPVAGGPDAVKDRIAKNVPFFKDLVAKANIPQIQ